MERVGHHIRSTRPMLDLQSVRIQDDSTEARDTIFIGLDRIEIVRHFI